MRDDRWKLLYASSLQDLRTSAEYACMICQSVYQSPAADGEYQPGSSEVLVTVDRKSGGATPEPLIFTVKCKYGESKRFGFFTKLTAPIGSYALRNGVDSCKLNLQARFQPFMVGVEIAKTVASGPGLEKLKDWFSECCSTHKRCRKAHEVPLPTRTIDVGTACGSEIPFLSCNGNGVGRYLALSYCWGGKVPYITTLSTLDDRKNRIDFSELPQTFQDAITMTREFGYRHLWIDALCIVQDSITDWDIESSKMAQVYENADFTISALDALSSRSGFLLDRAQNEAEVAMISPHERVFIRPKSRRFRQLFKECPLSDRAWTFQEHFLSTALLHFSTHETFWECRTCVYSESGDCLNVDPFTKSLMDIKTLDSFEPHFIWRVIVNDYSRRTLTFASDKLPALAGLAEKLSGHTKCDYLAGLWKNSLTEGLLWQALGQVERARNPEQYRAPSWSWAALDGKIGYDSNMSISSRVPQTGDLQILEAHTELVGQSEFGSVRGGYLKVLGSFRRENRDKFGTRDNLDNKIAISRFRTYRYLRVATYKAPGELKEHPERYCTCYLLLERWKDNQSYQRIGYAELWSDHQLCTEHVDSEEILEAVIV
jgi:hypothetical protein